MHLKIKNIDYALINKQLTTYITFVYPHSVMNILNEYFEFRSYSDIQQYSAPKEQYFVRRNCQSLIPRSEGAVLSFDTL
jgi:hypothetical protein